MSEKGAVWGSSSLEISSASSKKIDIEHNIILDLRSKTDKVIYDNLLFSSYFCTKVGQNSAHCSQFKENEKQTLYSQTKTNKLYSYTFSNGQALRVYKTKNGAAHLEFKESEQGVLHRYTFTSAEKASNFASQNEQVFKTENFDWDISYLDYIL